MFDISVLKGMKLPELQQIAKLAKTIKIAGVKKEVLIQEILTHQAKSDTIIETPVAAPVVKAAPVAEVSQNIVTEGAKPKRARIKIENKKQKRKIF